jgi:hypothetical protein
MAIDGTKLVAAREAAEAELAAADCERSAKR